MRPRLAPLLAWLCARSADASSYYLGADGSACLAGADIETKVECQTAATALGVSWTEIKHVQPAGTNADQLTAGCSYRPAKGRRGH